MLIQVHEKPREADFFSVCNSCLYGCCTGVRPPVTQKRRRIIERFLKENAIAIDNPFENGRYSFPRETSEGYCIFFDKATKRCRIHPVKPETCVAGPFTFAINKKTRKIEWFLKKDAICPLARQLCKDHEASRKHVKSAKHELRKLVHDLDAEALRAVVNIDEPETVKVGENSIAPSVLAKLKP